MSVQTQKLFYTRIGNGSRNLLLFHGFGQNHSVFLSLAKALSAHYTCFLFDLYYHGESVWKTDEQPLEKKDWQTIIGSVLDENQIQSFSLLGYSLGARFAFATLEAFPQRTEQLLLVAPDGIKTSSWYSLATYPVMLRRLFKSMIGHHNRFLSLAQALQSLNLVDKGLLRFAEQQMNTEEKRRRVYYSWVIFRHLSFDMPAIGKLINTFSIRLVIITGRYDKVIKGENMARLTKHVKDHHLKVIDTGHNGLLGKELEEFLLKVLCDTQMQNPPATAH